jgi:hypothetical protein
VCSSWIADIPGRFEAWQQLGKLEVETKGATAIAVIGDMIVVAQNTGDAIGITQLTPPFV